MTTSSARPRPTEERHPHGDGHVAPNSPSRRSNPAASAASAPVKATWLSASPVKTCERSTTKYPTAPQQRSDAGARQEARAA